jgi:hypothetical protein
MGKAASNEKIKVRALYFNNVAVGATIAGSIVPLLAYARELIQSDNQFTPAELGITVLLVAVAAVVAAASRFYASAILSKLED